MTAIAWTAADGRGGEVTITSRDRRGWESHTGKAWYESALSERKMAEAAGLAAIRLGQFTGSLAEFYDQLEDLQIVGDTDEPADPTRTAPGAGS